MAATVETAKPVSMLLYELRDHLTATYDTLPPSARMAVDSVRAMTVEQLGVYLAEKLLPYIRMPSSTLAGMVLWSLGVPSTPELLLKVSNVIDGLIALVIDFGLNDTIN